MFVLAEMKDTVRIPPFLFNMPITDAIIERLNKKFANKVIHKVGLCIALWDLTKLEESYVFPGDAASHTVVRFRYVVFRPFIDEILVGTVKSCTKDGVHVSLVFFDDILIPPDCLQTGSHYSTDEQDPTWIWDYAAETGDTCKLFIEPGEKIRFRVVEEMFTDTSPSGPEMDKQFESLELEQKKAPYSLVGSINEPGLGMVRWWSSNPAE